MLNDEDLDALCEMFPESLLVVLGDDQPMQIQMCAKCGSLVQDYKTHFKWHKELGK